MYNKLIKRKTYQIVYDNYIYSLTLKEDEHGLITTDFRPPDLSFDNYTPVQEKEFLRIWVKYIIGLWICNEEKDIIERNIGALTLIARDSMDNQGSIDSHTLLILMDCFANVLHSEGISDKEIRKLYVQVLKELVDCFPDNIIETETKENYISSSSYRRLVRVIQKMTNFGRNKSG